MSGISTYRRDEADRIFTQAMPLIDSVLLQNYALPRADAVEMEACLRDWFHAFVRRPGSPETLERLRPHLLAMACNAGHVYWSSRTDVPNDGNVRRSLSLGPERIAIEMEKAEAEREKSPNEPEKENR
jgi:hypothetical protein